MRDNITDKNIAELSGVTFRYADADIVDGVSLTIAPGERVGIVGESGCGKSTLIKILSGLLVPAAGSVTVAGETSPEKIRSKVSLVMQSSMLLPMTIYENITMGHGQSEEQVRHVLRQASLLEWVDSLPDGMHTYLGDRADELSGGQAQRIAIARALLKDAPLLLLDEPTASLDDATATSVLASLDAATSDKSRTIVHVTHQVGHLTNYHRILHMQGGRLYE